jgi:hypothetical protein
MKRIPVLLLILVAMSVSFASAREVNQSWDSLKQLQPGQKIEVVDVKMKYVTGTFASLSEEGISLNTKAGLVTVERPNVVRVSLPGGKRTRNALIGLAIGAAGGAALGAGIMENEDGYAGAVAGTSALFAGVGAGVGAAFPGTRTIYRAPTREAAAVH